MMEQGFYGCLGRAVAAVLTVVLAAAVISLLFRIFILLLPIILNIAFWVVVAYLVARTLGKIGEALR